MKRLFVTCALVAAHAVQAQVPVCEPEPQARFDTDSIQNLRELLRSKNFAALEDQLGDRISRYEKSQYSDLAIQLLIEEMLETNDASFEPLLAQWVRERPNQFVARLVKANYHVKVGYAKRGKAFISGTSSEQVTAMAAEFQKATPDLQAAMKMRPNSALPFAALIQISRATSGRKMTLGWLRQAETADPSNQAARWVAIKALDQRWGGHPEDLSMVLKQVAEAPLPDARRRVLQWKVEMTKAEYAHVVTKQYTEAMLHYRKAASFCTSSESLWQLSNVAQGLENWQAVIESVSEYLVIKPSASHGFSRRGWAKESLGNMPDALRDYEIAASLDNPWAQNKLGYMLMTGDRMPKDLVRARQLLEASAAKGNANAIANLDALSR